MLSGESKRWVVCRRFYSHRQPPAAPSYIWVAAKMFLSMVLPPWYEDKWVRVASSHSPSIPPPTNLFLGQNELCRKTFYTDKLERADVESFKSGNRVENTLLNVNLMTHLCWLVCTLVRADVNRIGV